MTSGRPSRRKPGRRNRIRCGHEAAADGVQKTVNAVTGADKSSGDKKSDNS
jgi:hypothetical protein